MKAEESFGVVVRGFGLYVIFVGVPAIHGIVQAFGLRDLRYFDYENAAAFAAFYLVAGLVLLRKSDAVVRFAYPPHEPRPLDDSK